MDSKLNALSQGDIVALGKQILAGDNKHKAESWVFPEALRQILETEVQTYDGLKETQNLDTGTKQDLVTQKNAAFVLLTDLIRKVVHYVKALGTNPDDILVGYGYQAGHFPLSEGDIVALAENIQAGDTAAAGQPWAMTPEMRSDFDSATTAAQTFMIEAQLATGEKMEATQTQNESRARLEDIMGRCREWLYGTLPQGRHDDKLVDYGFSPLPERHGATGGTPAAPSGLMCDTPTHTFTWSAVTGATSYQLRYSSDGVTYEIAADPDVPTCVFYPGTGLWYFKVRARNASGFGPYSAVIQVDFSLAAPLNKGFSIDTGSKIYGLLFDSVIGADHYEVETKIGAGGSWIKLADITTSPAWLVPPDIGDIYWRLRAVDSQGNPGPYSNETVNTFTALDPVTNLTFTLASLGGGSYDADGAWDIVATASAYTVVIDTMLGRDPYGDMVFTNVFDQTVALDTEATQAKVSVVALTDAGGISVGTIIVDL